MYCPDIEVPAFTSSEPEITNIDDCEDQYSSENFSLHSFASHGDKNAIKKVIHDCASSLIESKDPLGQTPLICSVADSQIECAELLLKFGARVDNSDNSGQTALHIAVNKGLYRCAKLLLAKGALWYQKDIAGATALHLASVNDSPKCLALLLKTVNPGLVDVQDGLQQTALHWSAAYTNPDHIKLLLKKDANISLPDVDGKTPLHWAATSSSSKASECVKIFINEEPGVINWQDYSGHSALHLAVASGTTETVDFLTSRPNCDIDVLDNLFLTPLHWAAQLGLSDKAALLLDRGALFSSIDKYGATPLHYAAYNNKAETVKIFLSRSYVCDIPDAEGQTAFFWAAARKADDVIKMMVKHSINLSYKDKNGLTALHVAAIQGHASTVELLLELNAPIDIKDKLDMTPFLRACEMGKAKVVQILAKKGAAIDVSDVNGRTGMHWAAKKGCAYVCQVLIHHKCNYNLTDYFGKTPLHYTCLLGYVNCACVLLESGANPDIPDDEGIFPLHLAAIHGYFNVVKLLCDRDAFVNPMALLDEWLTPLDCAISNHRTDVAKYLREVGGVRACEIEDAAARKLQEWFKIAKNQKKKLSEVIISEKPLDQNLENTINVQHTSHKYQSHLCVHTSEAVEKIMSGYFGAKPKFLSEKKCKSKTLSKIPIATWRLQNNCQYEVDKSVHMCNCSEQSEIFIPSIWCFEPEHARGMRHGVCVKTQFQKMQEEIAASFPAEKDRQDANEIWLTRLTYFLNTL